MTVGRGRPADRSRSGRRLRPDAAGDPHAIRYTGTERLVYLSIDCFTAGPPAAEPTWDSHVRAMCAEHGWDFDAVRLGPVDRPEPPVAVRIASSSAQPRSVVSPPARGPRRDRPARRPRGRPEPYADYRPIFETKRLNVTHVRIRPGETVPAHTHAGRGPGLLRRDGRGLRRARWRADRRRGRQQRPHPAGHRARDHEHRQRARSTTSSSSSSSRSTHERAPARPAAVVRSCPDRAAIGAAAADHVAERLRDAARERRPGSARSSRPPRPRSSSSTALARRRRASTGRGSRRSTSTSTSGLPLGDPRSFGDWLDEHICVAGPTRAGSELIERRRARMPTAEARALRRAPRRRRPRPGADRDRRERPPRLQRPACRRLRRPAGRQAGRDRRHEPASAGPRRRVPGASTPCLASR